MTRPILPHSCGRCGVRWAGVRISHCGACHLTFASVNSFDTHRKGGICNDPPTVGMRISAQGAQPGQEGWPLKIWANPMSEKSRSYFDRLRSEDPAEEPADD